LNQNIADVTGSRRPRATATEDVKT
jgi:hypothetical protein